MSDSKVSAPSTEEFHQGIYSGTQGNNHAWALLAAVLWWGKGRKWLR